MVRLQTIGKQLFTTPISGAILLGIANPMQIGRILALMLQLGQKDRVELVTKTRMITQLYPKQDRYILELILRS